MRLPPLWVRRLIIDPGVVLGVALALVSMPLWAIASLVASRIVPGRWRILRIVWFLFLYLLIEAASLLALFVLWVAAGFGWKVRSPGFQGAHYRLLGWMLRRVVRSAMRAFRLTVDLQDPPRQTADDPQRRPALILSRHAGPGDSILLMDFLVNGYRRRPRIVLKDFLQLDPAVDVALNRLPTAFVPTRDTGEALIEAIEGLASGMGSHDAFVIFPEGANFTPGRQVAAIRKLVAIGRPDLAERADELQHTLPPRTRGVQAALAAAPDDTDVFFIGHAGLESLITAGDIWRAMPMDTAVAAGTWIVPADQIPPPDQQEAWLYGIWSQIDAWIVATLAATSEPGATVTER